MREITMQRFREDRLGLTIFEFVGTSFEQRQDLRAHGIGDADETGLGSFEEGEEVGAELGEAFHFGEAFDAFAIEDGAAEEAACNFEGGVIFGESDGNFGWRDGVTVFESDGDGAMEFGGDGLEWRTGQGFFREGIFNDAKSDTFEAEFRANFGDGIDRDAGGIGHHEGVDAIEEIFVSLDSSDFFIFVHDSSVSMKGENINGSKGGAGEETSNQNRMKLTHRSGLAGERTLRREARRPHLRRYRWPSKSERLIRALAMEVKLKRWRDPF